MMIVDFKELNRRVGRPNIDIVGMYESILRQKGIHYPMTKKSFNVCYQRYQYLGGKVKFSFKGEK